jgi:hypothetical protein
MAVKYGWTHHCFGLGMLALSAASVGILLYYLKVAGTFAVDSVVVEKISGRDTEAMSYIVTYLIPFLDIKIDEPSNFIALCLFKMREFQESIAASGQLRTKPVA